MWDVARIVGCNAIDVMLSFVVVFISIEKHIQYNNITIQNKITRNLSFT